jgi:hypothetical protein
MTFDATIIHWRTIGEFAVALKTIKRPSWCRGVTHHNTYVPDDLTWRGMASMISMRDFYRDTRGWTSGPHLYLCAQAPNPTDTGIWQMTPITHVGTHAGDCNHDHLGIESVGNFEDRAPSPDQYALLLQITRLVLQQWGLPPEKVNVHNECMTGRTCPGKHLTGAQIRADLQRPINRPPPLVTARYRVAVRISQRQEGGAPYAGELTTGEAVLIDLTYDNGMAHLADGRGFVPLAALELV